MKHVKLLLVDVATILVSTLFGLFLRDNLEISSPRILGLIPYLMATLIVSVALLPLFGINRLVWRFSALPDYLKLISAMFAVTIGSVSLVFAYNRLDGVPRSLPLLQFNLAITLLIGLRVFYRLHHTARRIGNAHMAPLKIVEQAATETVLLVGLSRLTEAYLQSVAEMAPQSIRVVGILAHREQHVGRIIRAYKVLGTAENIASVLSDLEVSGVVVRKIVIAASSASLTPAAQEALEGAARTRSINLISLPASFGLEGEQTRSRVDFAPAGAGFENSPMIFQIQPSELEAMRLRRYWGAKRAFDVFGALALLIVAVPLMAIAAACVAMSGRGPLVFWQERPGLGGRSFRLFKFRSMGPAFAPDGRALTDAERSSKLCNFLRRTRLDELPQLVNILIGDMSFIGPRPLLPRDQDAAYRARLLVRPGLTGWAQVIGGRAISAEDKAALDIWYVKNASLLLDLKIFIKTIPIVVFGETISRASIETAWRELREAGVLPADFQNRLPHRRAAA